MNSTARASSTTTMALWIVAVLVAVIMPKTHSFPTIVFRSTIAR